MPTAECKAVRNKCGRGRTDGRQVRHFHLHATSVLSIAGGYFDALTRAGRYRFGRGLGLRLACMLVN